MDAAPICTLGVLKYVKEQVLGLQRTLQGKQNMLVEEDKSENCTVCTNTFWQRSYQRLPQATTGCGCC